MEKLNRLKRKLRGVLRDQMTETVFQDIKVEALGCPDEPKTTLRYGFHYRVALLIYSVTLPQIKTIALLSAEFATDHFKELGNESWKLEAEEISEEVYDVSLEALFEEDWTLSERERGTFELNKRRYELEQTEKEQATGLTLTGEKARDLP